MTNNIIDFYQEILINVNIELGWRIFPSKYSNDPLGVDFGNSRFSSPNFEFKTLYIASDFVTSIREAIIRDKLDGSLDRKFDLSRFSNFSSVAIKTKEQMLLMDLTDGSAFNAGVPASVRHNTKYNDSQELALYIYNNLVDVDGFHYRSRFDDRICFAIFERSIASKLEVVEQVELLSNPLLYPALTEMKLKTYKF